MHLYPSNKKDTFSYNIIHKVVCCFSSKYFEVLYTKHQFLVLITISLIAFPRPILPKEKLYFKMMPKEIKTRAKHDNSKWRRGYCPRHQARVSSHWEWVMSYKEYYKTIKREKDRDEEK